MFNLLSTVDRLTEHFSFNSIASPSLVQQKYHVAHAAHSALICVERETKYDPFVFPFANPTTNVWWLLLIVLFIFCIYVSARIVFGPTTVRTFVHSFARLTQTKYKHGVFVPPKKTKQKTIVYLNTHQQHHQHHACSVRQTYSFCQFLWMNFDKRFACVCLWHSEWFSTVFKKYYLCVTGSKSSVRLNRKEMCLIVK